MNTFKESDKVVCITPPTWDNRWEVQGDMPQVGRVYVVIRVWGPSSAGRYGLILVGSSSIQRSSGIECGFASEGFRKLEDVQRENQLKLKHRQ